MSGALRLAVFGETGRMGRAVVRLAEAAGHTVVFRASADTGNVHGLAESGAMVAIDFSHASAFAAIARACVESGVALVSGTTGFEAEGEAALAEAARSVAVLWEPNMSIGVFVLGALVREATRRLGEGFDVEIVETHHKHKLDAPSGTALRLAESVRAVRALAPRHGRHGASARRGADELGMHAVRGGSVVGDHTVSFFGESERLELSHRAESRDVFASGALRAASWLAGKPAGRYGLADVLSL